MKSNEHFEESESYEDGIDEFPAEVRVKMNERPKTFASQLRYIKTKSSKFSK